MLELINLIPHQFLETTDSVNEHEYKIEKSQITIDTTFKLPISYLESSELFVLSDVVSNDLELSTSVKGGHSMYEYLFQPKHKFAKDMINQWKYQFTNNQEYLKDTQQVILNMSNYRNNEINCSLDCNKITTIWEDVKSDNDFLNRYGFLDWEALYQFNESPSFLQILTVMNVMSPAVSLLMPILFFIFPFLMLKFQGIPITFEIYLSVLKDLAKNHFIGKALMTFESLSWDKIIYLMITFALYLMQIYQNVHQCQCFHKNIALINNNLIEIRNFTNNSIESMENFLEITAHIDSYAKFSSDIRIQRDSLKQLNSELQSISTFKNSFGKFSESGYMLRCYYRLHSNKDYEDALRYAVGFEGYVNNLLGIHNNIMNGKISFSEFDVSGNCEFEEQYYPPLINESPVKNTCDFSKNMIISSPNKSGKTTILKTTTINIIFTQQFGCGFYKSAKINPYTHIHSYLNIPDTSGRDSLFQAESRRCKEIIDIINDNNEGRHRHFCVFDELFSGTNPEEASKAGHAFLKYLTNYQNVTFILTTHYFKICKKFNKSPSVQNYKMEVIVREDGTFEYTYKIKKGISKIKGGIRVLKDMNFPDEIINTIQQ